MFLSSSDVRGGNFISVNNFSAQYLASSKNRHILNFRVEAVRDIKLCTCLSKNTYVPTLRIFGSLSIRKSAYLNVCLISSDNQWPR